MLIFAPPKAGQGAVMGLAGKLHGRVRGRGTYIEEVRISEEVQQAWIGTLIFM